MDVLAIFTTPEAWISLITLIFLEIVLGVDNIVFISITTNRLPEEKQHIGRKLGLAGAMLMRILFLCFASWLVHMTAPLFTIALGDFSRGMSIRDIILLVGGLYLLYKGISELRGVMRLDEEKDAHEAELYAAAGEKQDSPLHSLTLPRAVGTIMIMDIVFSIDSVITAVGLAEHLIIMVLAVMIAVVLMMVFIDAVSDFINKNVEMKILALAFIAAIGVLLVLDALGITTGIEMLDMHAEKLMVYFAMVACVIMTLLQMRHKSNLAKWQAEIAEEKAAAKMKAEEASAEEEPAVASDDKVEAEETDKDAVAEEISVESGGLTD